MMPFVFQASSILRYSVILFWRFFAAVRLSGLMFSNPMNTRVTPARFAFAMKFSILWPGVDLDHQAERNPALLPQFDQAIEDRLPLLVAREIVVGDEKFVDPLRPVETHEMLDVVGRAVARLTALHVDDRAE